MLMKEIRLDIEQSLHVIAKILIRCFLGGMLLLSIWFVCFAFGGDWIYQIHTRWFLIPRETFDSLHYGAMAATKIMLLLFFLLPYIAIRLLLKPNTR